MQNTQTPPSPTFLPGPNRTQAEGGQISHQEEWPPKLQAQQVVMVPNSLWCQNVFGGMITLDGHIRIVAKDIYLGDHISARSKSRDA